MERRITLVIDGFEGQRGRVRVEQEEGGEERGCGVGRGGWEAGC